MPTYILPQVLVFQEFEEVPTAITDPLRACIVGPQYALHRYSDSDEKSGILVGTYDYTTEECYSWPGRGAGGEVDESYTKVYFDDALLQYYHDSIGVQSGVEAVSGYANRIRCDSLILQTANGYSRSSVFYDRDVAVGDIVQIEASPFGSPVSLESQILSLVADIDPAAVSAGEEDAGNQATTSAADSISQTAGTVTDVTAASDASSYDGLEDGDVTETYIIEVTEASAGSDATTAKLSVTSASGNDDQASVTPAAFGSPTNIGTRGLTVTFSISSSSSSSSSSPGISYDDLLVGQKWTVTVTQDFTANIVTSGGTYSGTYDDTYIIEVTSGGLWADSPTVDVRTAAGLDSSGPHTITGTGAYSIGTKGVTVALSGTALCKGDIFTIPVTAAADAEVRTIVLANNLPEELRGVLSGSSSSSLSTMPDLDLKLFIKKDIQVEEERTGYAPLVNWEQSSTEICTKPGILAYDATWKSGTTLLPLSVISASVYVEYRDLRSENSVILQTISDISDVATAIGPISVDNPLSMGVYKALLNSNGTPVKYLGVAGTDLEDWTAAIEKLEGRDDVYGLVPLTQDKDILDAFDAHISAESTPENGRWRTGWFNREAEQTVSVYAADSSGDPLLATIEDDPNTSGTQYTLLVLGGGEFIENSVRSGDMVRTAYATDGFGNVTYDEYVVDAVLNEETIRLLTGPSSPVSTASKIEIWRTLTQTELAAALALYPGLWGDRRIYLVWPDWVGNAGVQMRGYYLCAALAGLRSGVAPHQGLTNVQVAGFDDVSRTTEDFTRSQLDTMAGAGYWIVTQDPTDGDIYTRHQLSTDNTSLNTQEQTLTTNTDSISYVALNRLSPFIGRGNVGPTMIARMRVELRSVIEYFKNTVAVQRLGPQLLEGTITRLEQNALRKDRIDAVVDLEEPYPFNNLELHLMIS